jgi:drug/metabolite transporter (DMT)-like permease
VIAVLGGLGAAVIWAFATVSAARASRLIGAWSTLAGVSLIGLVLCIPLVATTRAPRPDDMDDLILVAFCGITYIGGLLANYAALGRGKVGIAAPIASTEGAIAAVIAIIAGESASLLLLVALGLIVTGLVLATLEPDVHVEDAVSGGKTFIVLAVTAAILFGISLYAAGSLSRTTPAAWIVIGGRVAGIIVIVLPLVVLRRLRISRAALPFLVISGAGEVAGYFCIVWGSGESIPVTAVLSSLFAVLATAAAFVMGERLARRQWLGMATAAVGVAAVTAVRVLGV